MRCAAVILSGGSGKRMNAQIPKQYMDLKGKPVLLYSLKTFSEAEFVDEIVIVADREHRDKVQSDIVDLYGMHKVSNVVVGGKERYHSVAHGLEALSRETDYVFIHDGARPFVTMYTLERCLHYAEKYKAAVAAVRSKDTVKVADDDAMIRSTPDRAHVWMVQTPQTFEYPLIKDAYRRLIDDEDRLRAAGIAVTDDTMVAKMYADVDARLVESTYDNIKLTTPEDMEYAETICEKMLKLPDN
ncbi:MAG: 2-C-methyl-D-erythritol 4-phosphate cytidylyltransferase [Lachnospiraceae bacterium]|nr:2-C-methyl-D-erythritol 4-phosphate cytidylyltransferase [Lachnospiraceae bacterium]